MRTWLLALVLAALVPVLALVAAAAWTMAESRREGLETRMLHAAHSLALGVEQDIANHAAALRALATSPAFGRDAAAPDLARLEAHALRVAERLGAFIAVTAPDGTEWLRAAPRTDISAATRPLPHELAPEAVARALESGRFTVSNMLAGTTPQDAIAVLILPVAGADGQPAALLSLPYMPASAQAVLAAHVLSENAFTALIFARQGMMVTAAGAQPAELHTSQLGWQLPADARGNLATAHSGVFTATPQDGGARIMGFRTLDSAPNWAVAVGEPLASHFAAWPSPLLWLGLGGMVAITLSCGIALMLGQLVLRPARALVAHARAVAVGKPAAAATVILPGTGIRELEALRLGFAGAEAALRGRADAAAAALEAQLESEHRLRAVLEQMPVGVTIAEAPSGRLIFHNARAEAILGHPLLPAADIGGYVQYGALHEDGTPFAPQDHALARALLGEHVDGEQLRYHRGNGVLTWLEVSAAPIRDASGGITLAVCAFTDVGAARGAAEALAAAEARSRILFQAAPVAAYVTDAEAQTILDCNATAAAMLGRPPEALRGLRLADLDAGPREGAVDAGPREGAVEDSPAGAPIETRHRRRDGTLRDVLITTVPLELEGRKLLYSAALDVTAQREAEAALAASEARLRLAMVSAGMTSWEVDLRTGMMTRPARVGRSRPLFPKPGHSITKFFADVVHPEDVARVRGIYEDMVAGRTPRYCLEYRVRRADAEGWMHIESFGAVVDADPETGAPLRAAGTSRDVTVQREAEAALQASQERFRFALEAAGGIGTWDWEVGTDRMIADATFAELFGMEVTRAATGAPLREYLLGVHHEDRARVQALLHAAIRPHASGDYAAEHRVVGRDGRVRWVVARGRCYHREGGMPARFPGVVIDITARRESEERQALLAHEVDHRAKNALAVAQSVVALTRAEDPKDFREAVSGRITALARAHTLLARENWSGAGLHALLEAEVAAYQDQATEPPRIVIEGEAVEMTPDAVQPLAMTLHELTTNAVKHGALSTTAGRLHVRWERTQEGGLHLLWCERGGPALAGAPTRRGFGTSVIEATVMRQLRGQVRLDWRPTGLLVTLDLPPTLLQPRWQQPLGLS